MNTEIRSIVSVLLNTNRVLLAGENTSEKLRRAGCVDNEIEGWGVQYYLPELPFIGKEDRDRELESMVRKYTLFSAEQYGDFTPQEMRDLLEGKEIETTKLRAIIIKALEILKYTPFMYHYFAPEDMLKYQVISLSFELVYCTDRRARELMGKGELPLSSSKGVKINNDKKYRVFLTE